MSKNSKYHFPDVPDQDAAKSTIRKFGLQTSDTKLWKTKWRRLCCNAGLRGSVCYLSFEQYMKLAVKANLTTPEIIGKHNGQYQMSRFGDIGDYVWGNCRFITVEENRREKVDNGGSSVAGKKISIALTGRTKETHLGPRSQAEKMRGRTKETHEGIARQAKNVSIKMTGRTKINDPGYAAISKKLKGRSAETHEYIAVRAEKCSKSFIVISPKGKKISGKNLSELCEKKSLDLSTMSKVCRGKRPHHKGWTGKFVQDQEHSERTK